MLPPRLGSGKYLAFLGRMCADKGPELAIRFARKAGLPLRLAAKVDKADQEYFDAVIRPLLNEPGVEFIGEINESEKASFLGDAIALLFPIDWPEPFGMVMIEAMACATPIIAMRRGSVAEILRDGISGIVVDSEQEFLAATDRIAECSRASVRREFENRFTSRQMARNYVRLYEALVRRHRRSADKAGASVVRSDMARIPPPTFPAPLSVDAAAAQTDHHTRGHQSLSPVRGKSYGRRTIM